MEQRSAEWFQSRLGKVTASKVDDVMVKVKNGESTYKRKYRMQLVTERLTNKVVPVFMNAAMAHGVEFEDKARVEYANKMKLLIGTDVREVGFIDHPTIKMAGASPDGLVSLNGLIEIKCPQPMTHTETLQTGVIAKKYIHQMQWQMACTGKDWCDFVSYHPDFPKEYQLFIKRVERDDDLISRCEGDIQEFLTSVEDIIKSIKENN
tara:strand:- start:1674 stop:2294 length:621 start_codon:yes stop_codon:yes gene_type:complete